MENKCVNEIELLVKLDEVNKKLFDAVKTNWSGLETEKESKICLD